MQPWRQRNEPEKRPPTGSSGPRCRPCRWHSRIGRRKSPRACSPAASCAASPEAGRPGRRRPGRPCRAARLAARRIGGLLGAPSRRLQGRPDAVARRAARRADPGRGDRQAGCRGGGDSERARPRQRGRRAPGDPAVGAAAHRPAGHLPGCAAAGSTVEVPNAFYGFRLTAPPPAGRGAVFAIVTEDPVSLGDLLGLNRDLRPLADGQAWLLALRPSRRSLAASACNASRWRLCRSA